MKRRGREERKGKESLRKSKRMELYGEIKRGEREREVERVS